MAIKILLAVAAAAMAVGLYWLILASDDGSGGDPFNFDNEPEDTWY